MQPKRKTVPECSSHSVQSKSSRSRSVSSLAISAHEGLHPVGQGQEEVFDPVDHHVVNGIDGYVFQGGQQGQHDDVRLFQHIIGDVLGDAVPLLPDRLFFRARSSLDVIMAPDIEPEGHGADQKDQGRAQLDGPDVGAPFDQSGAGGGVQKKRGRLRRVLDIAPLVRGEQQSVHQAEIILGKGADADGEDQRARIGPVKAAGEPGIDQQKSRRVQPQRQGDFGEKAPCGGGDPADSVQIPLRQRLIQRRLYHRAHAQLQKRDQLQKLRDGAHQAVYLGPVSGKDQPGQKKAADDVGDLKHQGSDGISF